MVFSLSVFLYIYFAFLVIWLLFALVAIYHMLKFGFVNFTTFFTTFIFIGGAVFLLAQSYNLFMPIDWEMNVSVLDGVINNNGLNHF